MEASEQSYVDFFQGVFASGMGLKNSFGIRVEEGCCCAVARIGAGPAFPFGRRYPLPTSIETLPTCLRLAVDDHLIDFPASRLPELLQGTLTIAEFVTASRRMPPGRAAEIASLLPHRSVA